MLLSIIIPVFNTEKYLLKCLSSIFDQDYQNIEVIVVNDGSTDNSINILEKLAKSEPRLRVFSQDNQGVVAARNLGIHFSIGEYILFVDSDDYLLPNCLSQMVYKVIETGADIVIANLIYDYESRVEERRNIEPDSPDFKEWSKSLLADRVAPSLYAKIYKRSLFNDINISDDFKVGEDFITTVLLFRQAHRIVMLDYFAYAYLQRDNSVMHKPSKLAIDSIPKFINWIVEYYSKLKFYLDKDFQNEMSFFILNRYYLFLIWGGDLERHIGAKEMIKSTFANIKYLQNRIPYRRVLMLSLFQRSNVLGKFYRFLFIVFSQIKKANI